MRLSGLLIAVAATLTLGCGRGKDRAKGPSPAELAQRAEDCFERGDYGCAMEDLGRLRQQRKGDPALLNRFALAARLRYYQNGDEDHRDQELVALREALAIAPDDPLLLVNFGSTCWETGLASEAVRAYRRVLELQPTHPDAALMRARLEQATHAPEAEDDEQP